MEGGWSGEVGRGATPRETWQAGDWRLFRLRGASLAAQGLLVYSIKSVCGGLSRAFLGTVG